MPFCGKCGTEYEEGSSCPACATEVEQVASGGSSDAGSDKKDKKSKKGKAKVIFVLIVIAMIVIMAVAGVVIYKAPLKPINKVMNSFNKKESYLEYAFSSYPKEWQKHISNFEDIYEDKYEGDMDSAEVMFDNLDDTYPNWRLRFEQTSAIAAMNADEMEDVEAGLKANFGYRAQMLRDYEEGDYDNVADAYDLSDREASKFIESMLDIYDDYEECEITKGYIVKGRYVLTYDDVDMLSGNTDEDTPRAEIKSDRAKFYVVQVNGDWVIAEVEYDSRPFEGENVWSAYYTVPMQLYQTLYSLPLN